MSKALSSNEKFAKRRELMRSSLYHFCAYFWKEIQGKPYAQNWVHRVLCRNLEAVYFGIIDDLVINIPPGFGKSYICNILYPCWIWIQDPDFNLQMLSLAGDLGERDSQRFYNLICSDEFQMYFGDVVKIPEARKNIKKRKTLKKIHNNRKGVREYTALTGKITGVRGDMIIVDDPNDVTHVEQESARKRINQLMRYLRTRDDNNQSSKIIIIQQRMHEEDATATALEMNFTHLCLPMYKDENTIIPFGAELDLRNPGDILCPEILDEVNFEKKKRDLPAVYLQTQYYMNPTPDGDAIIKAEDMIFQEVDSSGLSSLVSRASRLIISVDSSYKDSSKSDYAVISAIMAVGRMRYVFNMDLGQWDFSVTSAAIVNMFNLISSNFKKNCEIVIEDKANGQAIIKTLESIFKGRAIIKAVNPLGSKRARLMSVATFFENHEVVFLKNPIWASYAKLYGKEPGTPLHELILKQFVYFGYAANDDIPDSVGQGLLEMLDDGEPISIISISTDRLNSKIDWSDREQKVYGKIF